MSGLNLLYKFLLKDVVKGSGKASGILSIGGDVRKLADKKFQSYVMTAKKQGVDLDKLSEQEIKYMLQLNKPKGTTIGGHQVIDASSPEGQGITRDLFNMLDRQSGKNVIKTDFGGGITDIVTETITKIKTMEPIAGMKEANSVIARKGKYKNLTKEQSQKILKDTNDHIFERDIKPDPEDMADGGRTGFKRGGGKKSKKRKLRMHMFEPFDQGPSGETIYEKKEDLPKGILELLQKDPNFDLDTFLKTEWANKGSRWTDKGRFEGIRGSYNNAFDKLYSGMAPFGETAYYDEGRGPRNRNITMTDLDKAKILNHELRHKAMSMEDSPLYDIQPDYVKTSKDPDYFRNKGKSTGTGGHELFNRFIDSRLYPSEKYPGPSQPYFDKILRDHWEPNFKKYKDTVAQLNRENARGDMADGGVAGLLGEPTYADGGRTGFKKGTKFDPKRRTILKGIGALATLPIIGKYFKWAKPLAKSSKVLTSVPINNIDGMPLWFKPLVNKVIKEGDDVTKKFATADREIVHQASIEGKIGKDTLGVEDVRVTQNLDEGTIRVEYNSPNTIGESGVSLVYKKGEEIPIKVKGKNTSVKEKDKFTAMEDDFYPQQTSPDDFDIEFTENIVKNVDDLYSDTSKLKQFATGKNLTIKEISESMKKKNILKEIDKNPNDHAFRNVPDYDGPYEDFASGGRVPLAEGGDPGTSSAEEVREAWKDYLKEKEKGTFKGSWKEWQPIWIRANLAQGGRVPMWLGGGLTAGKGLTREMLKFMAKGSSHGKSPAEMLKMLNPKQFEKLLKDLSMYNKFSPETGIMAPDMIKNMIKKTKTDRTDMIEQLISSARSIKKGDDNIITYKNKIIEEMVSKGMDRKTAETLSETLSESLLKEVGPKGAGPKVTEQGLLELENILKNLLTKDRQLQASGGRASLSAGGLAGMLGE